MLKLADRIRNPGPVKKTTGRLEMIGSFGKEKKKLNRLASLARGLDLIDELMRTLAIYTAFPVVHKQKIHST